MIYLDFNDLIQDEPFSAACKTVNTEYQNEKPKPKFRHHHKGENIDKQRQKYYFRMNFKPKRTKNAKIGRGSELKIKSISEIISVLPARKRTNTPKNIKVCHPTPSGICNILI